MGFALLTAAWLFFRYLPSLRSHFNTQPTNRTNRVTGGVFNPQVSLALLLVGAISPIRFILYVVAQIVGAIVAAGFLRALLPGQQHYKYVPCLVLLPSWFHHADDVC